MLKEREVEEEGKTNRGRVEEHIRRWSNGQTLGLPFTTPTHAFAKASLGVSGIARSTFIDPGSSLILPMCREGQKRSCKTKLVSFWALKNS